MPTIDARTLAMNGSREADTAGTLRVSGVTPKGRVRFGATRDSGTPVRIDNVEPDDIVRVEYANGFVEWMRADDLYQTYPAGVQRGDSGVDAATLRIDPYAGGASDERGVLGATISVLEFFGFDPVGKAAEDIGAEIENRRIGVQGTCVKRCSLDDQFSLTDLADGIPASTDPILIFVHGTFSSTAGTFGDLWDKETSPDGAALRRALRQKFGDRVYALEHRSLTESPVSNALALLRKLPKAARLSLVTHSRGGLVGDLLALGSRARDAMKDPLNAEVLAMLCKGSQATGDDALGSQKLGDEARYAQLQDDLLELVELLADRSPQIERFVRVASPSLGTTLASGRLDRWLSLLSWLGGRCNVPLLGDALDFVLAVVKARTDPRDLPGLEAMMPGSAVTSLVNLPTLEVSADLTIIAGDLEPGSSWAKAGNFVLDRFFGGAHDLVVNTASMYGGSRRPAGNARAVLDRGTEVNHFRYFSNEKACGSSLRRLSRAVRRWDFSR